MIIKEVMAISKVTRCRKCALPDAYPGMRLDADGVCNYCRYYDMYREREEAIRRTLKKEIGRIIARVMRKRNRYDCIVAYSGGKDSTFLLYYLKKRFGLKILAHTFDNGFISEKTTENIRKVVKALGVEYRITRPPLAMIKEVFKYALEGNLAYPKEILAMMSPVCAACLGMVFGSTIKLAIKMKIPLMFIGFTPGQYPAISLENFLKAGSCMFISDKVYKDDPIDILKILRDPIDERFGERVEKYFFRSQYVDKALKAPVILFPFHGLLDYDERMILKEIKKLGWEKPHDTDSCSTNCLLNSLGIYACVKQAGYHPYIGELSHLVRQGRMSYDEAVRAEKIDEDSFAMRHCLQRLDMSKSSLQKARHRGPRPSLRGATV